MRGALLLLAMMAATATPLPAFARIQPASATTVGGSCSRTCSLMTYTCTSAPHRNNILFVMKALANLSAYRGGSTGCR